MLHPSIHFNFQYNASIDPAWDDIEHEGSVPIMSKRLLDRCEFTVNPQTSVRDDAPIDPRSLKNEAGPLPLPGRWYHELFAEMRDRVVLFDSHVNVGPELDLPS